MTRFLPLLCCALLLPAMARANGISVQTLSATEITTTAATVRGLVAAGVADATVSVDIGTTPELGQRQTVVVVPAGFDTVAVSKRLTGLLPGQVIYYRFNAQSGSVSASGSVLSFSTLSPQPPTVTVSSIDAGATFALVGAYVDPRDEFTTLRATCRSFGGFPLSSRAVAPITDGKPATVVFEFRNLLRQTAYLFEIVATNRVGDTFANSSFMTVLNAPPTASDTVGYVVRGGTAFVTLPINDPDGDPLSFEIETQPAFGSITYFGGRITYTADADFRSEDILSYVVRDGFGGEARGEVIMLNPFLENAGSYDAAIVRNSTFRAEGYVKLTVGRHGAFTGELRDDGLRIPLRGTFKSAGRFDRTIGVNGRQLRVQIAVNPTTRALTGSVSEGTSVSRFQGGLRRVVEAAAQAGRYTAELGAPRCPENITGHGWAALKVSPTGMARFAMRLPCGQRMLASAPLREDGSLLLPIEPESGFALLQIRLSSAPEYDLAGDEFPFALSPDPASSPRPPINGSRYFVPGITHSLLEFSEVVPALIDLHFARVLGLLPNGADAEFAVQPGGAFVLKSATIPKLELTADLETGVFSGRAAVGQSSEPAVVFSGVFLQKRNVGSGLFYSRSDGAFQFLGGVSLSPR